MAFHIALNMAGAVSAGAYTAGVLDFLVEALDEWYDARESQRRLHGDDVQSWTIPAHDVSLDVMSGASAGGMCAAISSIALQEEFDHVHQTSPPAGLPVNRLYQSWVRSIDIVPLLGTVDLPNRQGPVHSLLDSTPISAIANTALQAQAGRQQKREWIAEQMAVILTMSNLRGIPYSVDLANAGSFEERIAYHADRIQFAIRNGLVASTDTSIGLDSSNAADPNWPALRTAAMATGAFPVMLASRTIERKRAEYENRLWNINNPEPDQGECQSEVKIAPAWDDNVVPATFPNVYADGGVTNNNPFECARQYLVQAAGNSKSNPRDPKDANAAVITVAPFPGEAPFDPGYDPQKQSELVNVLTALLGTLISQTRFQGEDLRLTKDEDVSSRFAIAPSDSTAPDLPSLLCGSLGAFGGFIDQKFRDRDYQLGRRNCQQFLRKSFALPQDNVTITAGITKKPELQPAFEAEYSFVENGKRWYPIIPLMPALRQEILAPPRDQFKTTAARLEQVADAALNRVKTVLHAFANQPGDVHGVWSFVLTGAFDVFEPKLRSLILGTLTSQLSALKQV
ncbi:MAG TPA: hypothetical protein VNX18_04970 [Bryobacteraceae bacterium]|nr:hypothetical protein [Bryobacteraceae bacterium]